ncbi:hypothetical protein [Echinicola sp. 20G]|uniref:hypothetical protein n=1 Tax=Echinicola sp. 20G TaxID=2781961 RepID=UPI00190FEEEB|nr:hypothetical protein [Echinicola sp. 20G]
MKTKFNWLMAVICCFAISSTSFAQEENKSETKYYLNVSSEKDGVKENISKTYDDRQTMEKDPFFKDLGIDLPDGQHDKLVLETTENDKKISLSTMKFNSPKFAIGKHVAWVNRDEDVNVEILDKDGQQVKIIERRIENPDHQFKVGYPLPPGHGNFEFHTEEVEGGNTMVFSKNKQVEVFSFEKDDEGNIKMSDEEADKTIKRLEEMIKELKSAKKNN